MKLVLGVLVVVVVNYLAADDISEDGSILIKSSNCPSHRLFKYELKQTTSLGNEICSYLCFCQDDTTARCQETKLSKCGGASNQISDRIIRIKRSPFGFGDVFFRDATREALNKGSPQQCKPYESSYSEGCPPDDWCVGCTVCDCDANGYWDCHNLSFCPDGKNESSALKKPIKWQDYAKRPPIADKKKKSKMNNKKKPTKTTRKPKSRRRRTKSTPKPVTQKVPSNKEAKRKDTNNINKMKKNPSMPSKTPSKRNAPLSKRDKAQLKPVVKELTNLLTAEELMSGNYTMDLAKKLAKRYIDSLHRMLFKNNKIKLGLLNKRNEISSKNQDKLPINENKKVNDNKNIKKKQLASKNIDLRNSKLTKPTIKTTTKPNKPKSKQNKYINKRNQATNKPNKPNKPTKKPNKPTNKQKIKKPAMTKGKTKKKALTTPYYRKQDDSYLFERKKRSIDFENDVNQDQYAKNSFVHSIDNEGQNFSKSINHNFFINVFKNETNEQDYYQYTIQTSNVSDFITTTDSSYIDINTIKKYTKEQGSITTENIYNSIENEKTKITSDLEATNQSIHISLQKPTNTSNLENDPSNNFNFIDTILKNKSKDNEWLGFYNKHFNGIIDHIKKKILSNLTLGNYKKNLSNKRMKNKKSLRQIKLLKKTLNDILTAKKINQTKENQPYNPIRYIKAFISNILKKEDVNQSDAQETPKNINMHSIKIINDVCKLFGPCKTNKTKKRILRFKIKQLNYETLNIFKIIRTVKGLLRLVSDNTTKNLNLTLETEDDKIKAINKLYFLDVNDFDFNPSEAKILKHLQENIKRFVQSFKKFVSILNSILKTLKSKNIKKKIIDYNQDNKISKKQKYTNNKTIFFKEQYQSDPVTRLTNLLIRYNIQQNNFMQKMYEALIKIQKQLNESKTSKRKEKYVEKKTAKCSKDTAKMYSKCIKDNLKKINNISERIDSPIPKRVKRSLYDVYDEDDLSVEYLLMLMEYLLKKKYSKTGRSSDNIDELVDAIEHAPDIKPMKSVKDEYVHSFHNKKMWKNKSTPTTSELFTVTTPTQYEFLDDRENISDNTRKFNTKKINNTNTLDTHNKELENDIEDLTEDEAFQLEKDVKQRPKSVYKTEQNAHSNNIFTEKKGTMNEITEKYSDSKFDNINTLESQHNVAEDHTKYHTTENNNESDGTQHNIDKENIKSYKPQQYTEGNVISYESKPQITEDNNDSSYHEDKNEINDAYVSAVGKVLKADINDDSSTVRTIKSPKIINNDSENDYTENIDSIHSNNKIKQINREDLFEPKLEDGHTLVTLKINTMSNEITSTPSLIVKEKPVLPDINDYEDRSDSEIRVSTKENNKISNEYTDIKEKQNKEKPNSDSEILQTMPMARAPTRHTPASFQPTRSEPVITTKWYSDHQTKKHISPKLEWIEESSDDESYSKSSLATKPLETTEHSITSTNDKSSSASATTSKTEVAISAESRKKMNFKYVDVLKKKQLSLLNSLDYVSEKNEDKSDRTLENNDSNEDKAEDSFPAFYS